MGLNLKNMWPSDARLARAFGRGVTWCLRKERNMGVFEHQATLLGVILLIRPLAFFKILLRFLMERGPPFFSKICNYFTVELNRTLPIEIRIRYNDLELYLKRLVER